MVRVILPVQELEPNRFFLAIDGFIEKIDLSKVPKAQTLRTYAYLKPLEKKGLKLNLLERQLLLASNSAGIRLTSSLKSGNTEGMNEVGDEASHKVLSEH